jgi:hypothetical protein
LSSIPSIILINTHSLFTPSIPYKTQFPDGKNIVSESRLLRRSTHVSLFVHCFNLQITSILLLLFNVVPSILFIYLSYVVMMSRQILFQNISNTTSYCAAKRKCVTDTNLGNFCEIATVLSLLFFNPEMQCMQYLVGVFAVFPMFYYFYYFCYCISLISLIIKFFVKQVCHSLPEDQLEPQSRVCQYFHSCIFPLITFR